MQGSGFRVQGSGSWWRLRRPKRKPTPPHCARQPLPREGASVDTPSFLWKEVPRRGGGWMGIPLSPKQSLPRVGKAAKREHRFSRHNAFSQWGRQRGSGFAAKKGSQPRLAALGSPFQGKGLAWTLPPSYGRRCPEGAEVGWGYSFSRHNAFPAWGRWRAKRAG